MYNWYDLMSVLYKRDEIYTVKSLTLYKAKNFNNLKNVK